jgi:hypothetical protein
MQQAWFTQTRSIMRSVPDNALGLIAIDLLLLFFFALLTAGG